MRRGAAGIGDDGGLAGNEVAVNPAVLDAAAFVPAPACFLGAAEAGVIHHQHQPAPGLQDSMNRCEDGGDWMHVLDGQHARGGGEAGGGKEREILCVARVITDRGRPAVAGGADQRFGSIDPGDLRAAPGAGGRARPDRMPHPGRRRPSARRAGAGRLAEQPSGGTRCPHRRRADRTTRRRRSMRWGARRGISARVYDGQAVRRGAVS